jgi:hypothetical protein
VARPRSDRVEEVKEALVQRLNGGHCRPGDRFLSNRVLANKYQLSYQTADRLIRELCREGYLERRKASGTYIPGRPIPNPGVCLCFHARSRRPESFGGYLLQEMTSQLAQERIPFRVVFDDQTDVVVPSHWYAVLWEWTISDTASSGLILHRRPAAGIDSTRWDSVSVDDYSGGVCAAQALGAQVSSGSNWVVMAGPAEDDRSRARVAGFTSLLPSKVVHAGWFSEDGERAATEVLDALPSGIFCANDRLAEGLIRFGKCNQVSLPPLIGFDDAPIAAKLGLTTIAIPWFEMTAAAISTARQRLLRPGTTGTHHVVAPRPILRW